jgi:hypothetical protein
MSFAVPLLLVSVLVCAADAVQLVFDNFAFRDASASLNNSVSPGSFGTVAWRTLSGALTPLANRRAALVPNTSVVYPSTLGFGGSGFTALSPFNATLMSLLSPFTNNATTNLFLSVLAYVPRNINWRVGFGFANKHLTATGGAFDASTPNATNSFAFGFRVDNSPATTLRFLSSVYNVTRATNLVSELTAANLTYDEEPMLTTVVPVLTIMRLVPIKTTPLGYQLSAVIQSSSALKPQQTANLAMFNLQEAGNVTFTAGRFPTSLALYGFNCTVAQVRLVTTVGELFVAPPTPAPTPAPTPRPTPRPTPLPPGATLPPPPPPTPPTPAPSSSPDESFPPVPTPVPPRSTVAPTSASQAPASAAPATSDDSSLPIIIGCVVGGVALLGVVGVLFFLKKRKAAASGLSDVSFKQPQYAAIPRKPTESIGAYGNVDLSQNVGMYAPAGSAAVGSYAPPGMVVGAYGPTDVGDTFRSAGSASKPSEYSAIELSTSPAIQQW